MGSIKRRVKGTIQTVLHPLGLEPYLGAVPAVTKLASPIDAIYSQSDIVFEVPVGMCLANYHFSFGAHGWHPFVRTLEDYRQNQALTYGSSLLRRFYEVHQPRNLWEVFFESERERDLYPESKFRRLPTDSFLAPNPWQARLEPIRGEGNLSPLHGVQTHGPVSREKGQWEFDRLVRVYHSIRSRGYRPTRHKDGEIRGYFLKLGTDYRFFVRAGFHRMAALAVLRHPTIRVKFKAHSPRVVDLADIDNWPLVKSGQIEKPIADRIFRRYFTDNGCGKARNLGLLE